MNKTKVIFRWWNNDVIALFPEVAATMDARHCLSYQHVGQHAAADPYILIRSSRPATETEYTPLKRELESYYEYELVVVEKHTQAHRNTRQRDIDGGQGR